MQEIAGGEVLPVPHGVQKEGGEIIHPRRIPQFCPRLHQNIQILLNKIMHFNLFITRRPGLTDYMNEVRLQILPRGMMGTEIKSRSIDPPKGLKEKCILRPY